MSQDSSFQVAPRADAGRPGWPEIAAGLIVLAIVGYGGGATIARLGLDKMVLGLIFTALSGLAGLAGLAAAMLVRGRPLAAFGFRAAGRRWLLIGIAGGVVAFVAKAIAITIVVKLTGAGTDLQNIYAAGGSGGIWSLLLATLFLAVLTPLGEEFVFRGIVANALLRYGAVVGVAGSALIFALMHGINFVFPAALIVGLFNAELFRRTGSVWPGVVLHITFNLPTVPVMVMAGVH